MNSYKFETDQFGLSDNAVHLLRSRFNYETIDFATIDSIIIEKGRQVKNWFFLLTIGLILFCFGLFAAYKTIYEFFFADNFTHFYIEQIVLPILPFFLGIFSIYHSLKSGLVLKISSDNKIKVLPIGQLEKKSQAGDLMDFLSNNSLTKNKFKKNTRDTRI